MPSTNALFLHVTDAHLGAPEGSAAKNGFQQFKNADIKVALPGICQPERAELYKRTLRDLVAVHLKKGSRRLSGVIISGDATHQGDKAGAHILKKILLDELRQVGIEPKDIVVTPGNHDILSNTAPGSAARYENFASVWRDDSAPCTTPLLDGIEKNEQNALTPNELPHILSDEQNRWAILPINSSNWSQILRAGMSTRFHQHIEQLRTSGKCDLAEEIEGLQKIDAARVSPEQLNGLEQLLHNVPKKVLKIAVLHHHLLPVGNQEEVKPFADIINLGLLRQFLRSHDIRLVIHGHKHRSLLYYDHIYDETGVDPDPHRVLVIAGSTLNEMSSQQNEPFRLIELRELPYAPICEVTPIPLKIAGLSIPLPTPLRKRVWETDAKHLGPISIYGKDISDVYARARQVAREEGKRRPMICTVDFDQDVLKPRDLIPADYPLCDVNSEPANKLEQMVTWWQLPQSRIESRIPFIHGTRLRRYAGSFDQLEYITSVLRDQKKDSSKAIALLIDPVRDFAIQPNRGFASFCLVQFRGRQVSDGKWYLDCIGYYRAQEFGQWWPVNVAELRQMQVLVATDTHMSPGQVTTITSDARIADDSRTPTQVAVPLIDQWLDTHTSRIPIMARAISGCQSNINCDQVGRGYLDQCLNDLYASTETFQADGNPIAIEGIAFLLSCLTEECRIQIGQGEVIDDLENLLRANKAFDASEKREREFRVWRQDAQRYIQALAKTLSLAVGEKSGVVRNA